MILSLLFFGIVSTAQAQEQPVMPIDTDACTASVEDALGTEQRFYRAVVFGEPKAADAPLGTVRYDKQGAAWIKVGTSSWKSTAENSNQKGNAEMELAAEFEGRRGWLEVKQATTSELLPPILQSVRALQCRTQSVCELLNKTLTNTTSNTVFTVQVPGCLEEQLPRLDACAPKSNAAITQTTLTTLLEQCNSMTSGLFTRERELLKLTIAYDAATRSLYQFLGITQTFFSGMRETLLGAMWQAVRQFEPLGRIPCFSAQCDQ